MSAGLALGQFLWHYPSPATPLFTTDLGPVAVLLKQARGAGMVLAGMRTHTLSCCHLPLLCWQTRTHMAAQRLL